MTNQETKKIRIKRTCLTNQFETIEIPSHWTEEEIDDYIQPLDIRTKEEVDYCYTEVLEEKPLSNFGAYSPIPTYEIPAAALKAIRHAADEAVLTVGNIDDYCPDRRQTNEFMNVWINENLLLIIDLDEDSPKNTYEIRLFDQETDSLLTWGKYHVDDFDGMLRSFEDFEQRRHSNKEIIEFALSIHSGNNHAHITELFPDVEF